MTTPFLIAIIIEYIVIITLIIWYIHSIRSAGILLRKSGNSENLTKNIISSAGEKLIQAGNIGVWLIVLLIVGALTFLIITTGVAK
tara:strand:+ start:597 stop:854 length:258 start_codon:yes stop_codon:yes gene_type:complete